jgi:sugar O-acyltransferase (sialic acid O-acetyltransferase NeuD family)
VSLVVLCAGGHASVVIEALRSGGVIPVAATDSNPSRKGHLLLGVPIIGSDDHVLAMAASTTQLANGLGNRASRTGSNLSNRRQLFDRFAALGYAFPVVAHASAVVASDAAVGAGSQIMAGAIIQPGVRIGRNVLVNTRAVVEHDCVVEDHCHLAPGCVLCFGATVGQEVHVGAGAIVLPRVNLGSGSVVAAGAVVANDLEPNSFVDRNFCGA